jgi:hypothetical protein
MSEFEDFTEVAFRDLLQRLKTGAYRFARYGDSGQDRHVLWRHDVDFSMHRAARLACIEAEEGATATYFINLRSTCYNPFEPEIEALIRGIVACGHEIGLHFDAEAYAVERWSVETLGPALDRERMVLELLTERPIRAVSWHNPDLSNLLELDATKVGGLLNAYSAELRRNYTYCSDSNGYWRFKPMDEVICEGHQRLHLLTHPEWWTPEAMLPSERIDRAILGRARKVRRDYDALLQKIGRRNVKV